MKDIEVVVIDNMEMEQPGTRNPVFQVRILDPRIKRLTLLNKLIRALDNLCLGYPRPPISYPGVGRSRSSA